MRQLPCPDGCRGADKVACGRSSHGLIKEGEEIVILTGHPGVIEDHLGDMDFKVAGTAKGINALQMDIKVAGVYHRGAVPGAGPGQWGQDAYPRAK